MAKEGKSIGKGFGFYLVIILLVLVGAFIAVICAMVIMPKTKILGLQYFSYDDVYPVEKLNTGTKNEKGEDVFTDLDFSKIVRIELNCGSSNVSLSAKKDGKSSIRFVSKASGFAKAKDNVDYTYSVDYQSYKDGILKIDVQEPVSFLNLSNDMAIDISILQTGNYVSIPTVSITTTSGNVSIGTDAEEILLSMSGLTVSTTSGNVYLNKNYSTNIGYITISTESGSIINQTDQKRYFSVVDLQTKSGSISLGDINCTGEVKASLGNGSMRFGTLEADLIVSGANYSLNGQKVERNLSCASREMKKASINVVEVGQDVSFPHANESNINIIKIGGQVYINSTKGNVKIGGEYKTKDKDGKEVTQISREQSGISKQSFISSQSGKIDVIVNDKIATTHRFKSTSGSISVEYPTAVNSKNNFSSQTGSVTVWTYDTYKLTFQFRDSAGKLYQNLNSKLNIAFFIDDVFENPLKLKGSNGQDNVIDISTDGLISCQLFKHKNN